MNLLEKYYLQGKGKLMAGIFVPRSIVNLSHPLPLPAAFLPGKKSE